MTDLLKSVEFWISMTFVVIMKHRTSPQMNWVQIILTTLSAISGALVFTEPVYEYMGFDSNSWKYATAATTGLLCEHAARMLLSLTFKDILAIFGRGRV